MALTQPRRFEGQVRGVSHHGQETHLHKQAGYIDADIPSSINFSLAFRRRTIHDADIPSSINFSLAFRRRTIHLTKFDTPKAAGLVNGNKYLANPFTAPLDLHPFHPL